MKQEIHIPDPGLKPQITRLDNIKSAVGTVFGLSLVALYAVFMFT
jgi:hypothetical protein